MVAGELAEPVGTIVIGGGPGGYTAAARAAELGQDVVLVEQAQLGGVCLNVGCIPSKVLTTVAHDLARVRAGASHGVVADVHLDFEAVQAFKRTTVDRLVDGVGRLLAKVRVVQGTAFMLSGNRVSVEHDDQVAYFQYQHAIIATGSEPVQLPQLPFDHDRIVDSTGALAFTAVPETLVVVGGGYIGAELGLVYAQLGSRVTIVEAMDRLLTGFDPELARVVESKAGQLGVTLLTSTSAQSLGPSGLIVTGPVGKSKLPADRVLVAVGRRPRTRGLQLEDIGVKVTERGFVEVDDQCRTAVPNVYAIGDVTEGPALAHRASSQGRVAAEVIAGLPSAFDSVVPLIAFTVPEVASVGLSEQQAKAEGRAVLVGRSRFAASGRAAVLGEPAGLVKVVIDAETDVVLGVHIAGPSASDLIGEGTLAVETACRGEDILGTVHPHPTLVESIHEAVAAAERRRGNR